MKLLLYGTLTLLLILTSSKQSFSQNTYYHDGTGSPNALSSWWSSSNYSGFHPSGFNGGDSFLFVHGNHLTSNGNWSFSGTGTVLRVGQNSHLTLSGDLSLGSGTILCLTENAILETDTFSVSGLGNLEMNYALFQIGTLNKTVPELAGNFSIQAGIIELCGAGNQEIRGSRSYDTLMFTGTKGIKSFSSAITGSNNLNCLFLAGTDTVDAANRTIGSANTNFIQNSGLYRCSGTGTKPDAGGTYTINGGCIQFQGNSQTSQTVRNGIVFKCIQIDGSNVSTSSGNINLDSSGVFQVLSDATWNMSNVNVGIAGLANARVEVYGNFIVYHEAGLSGTTQTAIRESIDSIYFGPESRIIYTREGNQNVTALSGAYRTLVLGGTGIKSATELSIADSLILSDSVFYEGIEPNYDSTAVLKYSSTIENFQRLAGQEWPDTAFAPSLILDYDSSSNLHSNSYRTLNFSLNLVGGNLVIDSSILSLNCTFLGAGYLKAGEEAHLKFLGTKGFLGKLCFSSDSLAWKSWELNLPDTGVIEIGGSPKIEQLLKLFGGTLLSNDSLLLCASNGNFAQVLKQGGHIEGKVGMQLVGPNIGWSYLSSPLKLQMKDWHPQKELHYNGGNQNVFVWNPSNSSWEGTDSLSEFSGTKGYAINFLAEDTSKIFTFYGELNQISDFNASVSYSANGDSNNFENPANIDGWNLIGNPFACHLDWSELSTRLDGSINNYYYIYNSEGATYLAHNGAIGHSALSGTLPPFQAFFVKLGSASDTISSAFNFDSTLCTYGNQTHYKSRPKSLWVHLIGNSDTLQSIAVIIDPNSGYELNPKRDALIPGGVGSIYWCDENGIKSMIRSYPNFNRPLPFYLDFAGKMQLKLGFDFDWDPLDIPIIYHGEDTLLIDARKPIELPESWKEKKLYISLKASQANSVHQLSQNIPIQFNCSSDFLSCKTFFWQEVRIFTMQGQEIISTRNTSKISWGNLSSGFYVLKSQIDGRAYSQIVYHP